MRGSCMRARRWNKRTGEVAASRRRGSPSKAPIEARQLRQPPASHARLFLALFTSGLVGVRSSLGDRSSLPPSTTVLRRLFSLLWASGPARPGRPPAPMAGLLLLLAALALALAAVGAAGGTEADALLAFREALRGPDGGPPAPLSQWASGSGSGPCAGAQSLWYGVTCHPIKGGVLGLRLEYLGLQGDAPDMTPLASLPGLRAISFANNNLTGPFPAGLSDLPALKMLYLSRNKLAGDIPDDAFAPMRGLRKLYLSDNHFTGPIPSSITSPRLLVLQLSKNRFDGPLPDFDQKDLQLVDVSDNKLSGPIPHGLRRFNASMFQGNQELCGPPLDVQCRPDEIEDSSPGPSPTQWPPPPPGGLKALIIIAIVVVAIGAVLAAAGIITAIIARRNNDESSRRPAGTEAVAGAAAANDPSIKVEQRDVEQSGVAAAAAPVPVPAKRGGRRDDGRLVFIQEGRQRFELEDLLRASAEVLGSGNFGASYKATLLDGASMVVKRFKEMNGAGREDFNEHMRRLGRLLHPNLLPVVAYLYKKDEKLFVTEHIVNGSLAHLLHGGTRSSQPQLDWPKRLKIIKGVARALAYLYDELPMLTVPHGHLKSSNVLLDEAMEPVLSDYALVPVVTPQHATQVMVAYKSPECGGGGRASKKSDVWTLGILILEVLTGKFPTNYLRPGRDAGVTDLSGWVHSVVRDEWTGEVFDKDMLATGGGEGEMVKLLKLGLCCCEHDVALRCDVKDALARIEELRDRDPDLDGTSTAFLSDGAGAGEPRRP